MDSSRTCLSLILGYSDDEDEDEEEPEAAAAPADGEPSEPQVKQESGEPAAPPPNKPSKPRQPSNELQVYSVDELAQFRKRDLVADSEYLDGKPPDFLCHVLTLTSIR